MAAHDRDSYRHTMGHQWLGFNESTMSTILEGAGFRSVRYTPIPGAPDAKGPDIFVCSAERAT